MLCNASVKLRRASKFHQYRLSNLTRKTLTASYRGHTSDLTPPGYHPILSRRSTLCCALSSHCFMAASAALSSVEKKKMQNRVSSLRGAIDTTRPPCFTMNEAKALLKIIHFLPSDVVLNILHSPKSNTVVTKINCIQKSPMQNAPSFQRFVCIIMYSESRSCA